MKHHKFGRRSEKCLVGVYPPFVKVLRRALEISPYDFGVIKGARTFEEQKKEFEEGSTTTMNSRHLIQADGWAHAVDILAYVDGKHTYEHKYYRKVIQAVFTAAIEESLQITVGALWRDFLDSPHIETNPDYL